MSATTFFFYDLETSGLHPAEDRIMQFAGQRTDMALQPVSEPVSELIALTADVLPAPGAILLTGITPQQTLQDGWTEAGFLRFFDEQINLPGTIFTGYNSIRFDDEFMRYLHYRNFTDPYEWQWRDDRSRWDILDVVRMTRALRPDGISWPVAADGRPTNRLELLTAANGIDHRQAHDALSDVRATIAVAQLIRRQQPKLFDWLAEHRSKAAVRAVVEAGQPFVYSSGKYAAAYGNTTVAAMIGQHPGKQAALVYDLRFDPTEFLKLDPAALAARWRWQKDRTDQPLPVKVLQYNRCPAVAPLSVWDEATQARWQLPLETIRAHQARLQRATGFIDALYQALALLDDEREQRYAAERPVDARLYDGFMSDQDKRAARNLRSAAPADLTTDRFRFEDQRFRELLPLYKARNFSASLSADERAWWDDFRLHKLTAGGKDSALAVFFDEIQQLSRRPNLTEAETYLLEELRLYGQSIVPAGLAE